MPPDSIKTPLRDRSEGVKSLTRPTLSMVGRACLYRTLWSGTSGTRRLVGLAVGLPSGALLEGSQVRRAGTTSTSHW